MSRVHSDRMDYRRTSSEVEVGPNPYQGDLRVSLKTVGASKVNSITRYSGYIPQRYIREELSSLRFETNV